MTALTLYAAALLANPMSDEPIKISLAPSKPRFEYSYALPNVPPVLLDYGYEAADLANQAAKAHKLQGRVMWVDATANIDRYNTEEKIVALIAKLNEVGFNTVVLDVKPISGQVIYPSKIAPRLKEWREKILPEDFDPVPIFSREAKKAGLSLLVCFNAFSEGHSMFKVGPGYEKRDWQTVVYDTIPLLKNGKIPLSSQKNKPDGPDAITFYDSAAALPKLEPTDYAVSAEWPNYKVADTSDDGKINFPRRGFVLLGRGEGAAVLRAHTSPGEKILFDTEARYMPISEQPSPQIPLMMNPVHPEVQAYELSIMREFLANYEVDGVMYDDRFRYAGLDADFSELTRNAFEGHLGKKLQWPDDVFKFTLTPTFTRGLAPGPYYGAWMAWRSWVMKDYLLKVRKVVTEVRPGVRLGLYAGSWYGEYPAYGANLGSDKLDDAGFWFLTPDYQSTGMAGLLDVFMTGGYYPTPTVYNGLEWGVGIGNTIESAGRLTTAIARDETWSYVGLMLSQFKNDPDRLKDALQAACGATQGIMVFDLSHDVDHLWPAFAEAFASDPREAPHMRLDILKQVRTQRATYDRMGRKPGRLIIAQGSAGTGF
jgi:hypothetical protein